VPIDAWLPRGFRLEDELTFVRPLSSGVLWQIWNVEGGSRALLVKRGLADRWVQEGLMPDGVFHSVETSEGDVVALSSGSSHRLEEVASGRSPDTLGEAVAFGSSLRETRKLGTQASLHDGLYVERMSRLLPTYSLTPAVADDVVLGTWLAGGVSVSVHAERRIRPLTNWLGAGGLQRVIEAADLLEAESETSHHADTGASAAKDAEFRLVGRPGLQEFFTEHVIDIVQNRERYKAMGVHFPSAFVLHGPPGCGKTFGVERLVEFLGWPSYRVDASSVASPYIHETSKKVSEVFETAMQDAPAVLIIDEMEAFLANRESAGGSGHHRVEEVAEFLRRIPEAADNEVLVVAMTNRLEMIDPAILRRGRFDHVIEVGMASREEVEGLLGSLLAGVPIDGDFDLPDLAQELVGRPLSDVAFVVKEAGRLAARAGKAKLDEASVRDAMASTTVREAGEAARSIGFARE
jgi:cell division protease FtsH